MFLVDVLFEEFYILGLFKMVKWVDLDNLES